MKKKIFYIFVFTLFISGCKKEQHKLKNTLLLSTSSDPKSFNPIIAKETSTTLITGFIFEGLTRINGVTLKVEPSLATRWKVDKSGKIWKFYLRKDVLWNDGKKFTADDVVFTFNDLIYNDKIPTSSRDIFTIEGKKIKVIKIDDYTVEFILPEKFAPFLQLLGQEILPKHKLEKVVLDGKFTSSWGVNEKEENIVGTGPYKIKEYRPGEWIILKKNQYYWKKDKNGFTLPYIESIVFQIIPDPNMAILKFRTGEIDIISIRGQDYYVLKPLEKSKNFTIYDIGPSLGSEFLALNQNIDAKIPDYKKEWFSDINFRKCIAYSIDRNSIIKNVYAGFGTPQYGPMNSSCGFFYNDKIKKYEYNLQKAKEFLIKSGFFWKENILYDKKGNRVEFTIITNSNNFERVQIGNIIQNDLEKLGMKVNLLPIEFNTLVNKLTISKDWEGVIIGLTGGIEPHGGKNVWNSKGQLHFWNFENRRNYQAEKEIDQLFEIGTKYLEPEMRKKIYDRWQYIVTDNLPLIYTANSNVIYAVRNKFENLKITVYGGVLHNIEEIKIKENGNI
ncbi:MAG: ABC transporter substrate-binding protein [Candidatus Omnitrophica bacterium]|nr:ABC transporter substrate-binding protein [Candidatus Omnitrophota bacterium]MCM8803038.1 ABC transporter substrate-binding protein [Candidatus Omnitrophota bacterium]